MGRPAFQLLPPLRAEEYEALQDDIALRGCMVPVELDEAGNVLDGHNRVRICKDLGIRYRTVTRRFESRDEKVLHALKLNLLRRHLGPVSWAKAFRELCRVQGVKIGQGKRNDRTSRTMREVARGLGVDAATARRRLRLAEQLERHPDLASKVDAGTTTAERAVRIAREREQAKAGSRKSRRVTLPEHVRIEHCSIENLDVRDASLIVTDPPYLQRFNDVWAKLGEFAARALQPGRLLVTYCPGYALPTALAALSEHLNYVWAGVVVYQRRRQVLHNWRVQSRSKLILYLSKGKYKPVGWIRDVLEGNGEEKGSHKWQQPVDEAEALIEAHSKRGELVCDPFLGSGTTALAAVKLGRRFIGCDVDKKAVRTARVRIATR